jgi:glycosyltransferase involved in cell wall biosynthesis
MPRRILLLITDLRIGGTPTVVRELALRLNDPPEVNVEVACLSPWGPVADQLRAGGIEVTALNAKGAGDVGVIGRLIKLIRSRGYDTVFSFLIHANTAAAIASQFCSGVRFIQSIQTTQPNPRWHWWVQRWVQLSAEKIVVPSPSVAKVAQDWADIPVEKMVVIPNAVDCSTGVSPVQHGRDARATRIGFIGRFDPIKRIPDLLEAIKILPSQFHLHLFGQGPELHRIENQIRQLGISSRVTLHGQIENPELALRQIDLLVLPSQAEGFGLVLIEAMAAGIPVIATDAPGIRDVVVHQQTGLLVPIADPQAIEQAVQQLSSDDSLREQFIRQARLSVEKKFSWSVILPQYRALLKI